MPVTPATSVFRVAYSGTIGPAGTPLEIWSTGFWMGEFDPAVGGTASVLDIDPASLDAKALAFGEAIMIGASGYFTLTTIKINAFSVQTKTVKGQQRTGLYQVTDPTHETTVSVAGGAGASAPYQASVGWGLSTTKLSKGPASHGRMFLPSTGVQQGGDPAPFDTQGEWSNALLAQISARLTTAWRALDTADGANVHLLPALVAQRSVIGEPAFTEIATNPADKMRTERVVWSVNTRKNALPTAGIDTTAPGFAAEA